MPFIETDSYCLQTDVESWVQRGVFDTSSNPTKQQVLDFMAFRAGEIFRALKRGGVSYSVPTGGNPFGTPNDDGIIALKNLCIRANSVGAAADAIWARDGRDADVDNTRAGDYQEEFERLVGSAESPGVIEEAGKSAGASGRAARFVVTDVDYFPVFDKDTKF